MLGQNSASLIPVYCNCRDLPHDKMFYSCKKSISRENPVLPMEKFPSHVLHCTLECDNVTTRYYPIFPLCQVVTYRRLKTKDIFKLLALKLVTVVYERWPLTRGSKYSDLTGKFLMFWKSAHGGEVVVYERWSQPLYFSFYVNFM